MLIQIGFIVVGLLVLLVAGDLLVRGAVNLATQLKIPTLLISLTIVAFGTSAPEFVVSLQDVLNGGDNGIAMGNIIGSNIANILLVLGIPAIITPMALHLKGLRRHATVMLIATAAFIFMAFYSGILGLVWGLVLMGLILAYIAYVGVHAMKGDGEEEALLDDIDEYSETSGSAWKTPLFLILGLVGLPLGAHLLIENGSGLASTLGVRDELIGLTIVAFGTSLPELATVLAAAVKKHADVAVGNIVGSNIFNILFVGGTAGIASIAPGATPSFFPFEMRFIDMPVMAVATLILAILIYARGTIARLLGAVMGASYVAYIVFLGINAGII